MTNKPLFLQTMFRSGGTFLWSKLRKNGNLMNFIEPFHEGLGYFTHNDWEKMHQENIVDILRHPKLDQHYFAEYPIRETGGVSGFESEFSYGRHFLSEDDEYNSLKDYILYLINYSYTKNRTPTFKLCRGIQRTPWIKKHFCGNFAYIIRNPWDIYRSYFSFNENKSYFFAVHILISSLNRNSSMISPLIKGVMPELPIIDSIEHATLFSGRLSKLDLKDIVYYFWAINLATSSKYSKIIDYDWMAEDGDYRLEISEWIETCVGISLNFDDMKNVSTGSNNTSPSERVISLVHEVLSNEERHDALICLRNKLSNANWQAASCLLG